MSATLNGFSRSYEHVDVGASGFTGHGYDGSIGVSLPSLAPGTYDCPSAKIGFTNESSSRDYNTADSEGCCTVQVTRSGGPGEIVEGTFSGVLIQHGRGWIKIEDGRFAVVLR